METSRYEETMEYFERLDKNSEYAEMVTFGISPQGRDMKCLIISKEKVFTPEKAKATGKPIILIINGIHAGEIEGKDATMILAREILITKEKEKMIDDVILLVIPIFSVDGHERFGKYNRINQNGPEEIGWRTTSQNLNLNRDWMKADAPEMQVMLKLFSEWLPDFPDPLGQIVQQHQQQTGRERQERHDGEQMRVEPVEHRAYLSIQITIASMPTTIVMR
jgi:murein tripeptide amidase MpaA